ncbi:hypothetical protein ACLRGF_06705 [Mycetocola zhadangensis]|uniref:hypothetical protein n=1 Tax=Mycetocola zhadangensis TaxID=1164595 RepID=UPI003A4D2D38
MNGVRFEVMQGRTDYASGTLVLRVSNESGSDVVVSDAALSWRGFAEPAEWDGPTDLPAGRTIDLRTSTPGMNCAEPADTAPNPTLSVMLGDAITRATPTDPLGTLPRLHDATCITALVDRTVAIDLAGPLRIDGTGADAVAVLPLRFTATGADGTVAVRGVSATPLLAPAGGTDSWPLSVTVTAASAVQVVDLEIRPARCDPHAITEDKIGTILVLSVDVDGRSGEYRYAVDDTTRNALYSFVTSVCAAP